MGGGGELCKYKYCIAPRFLQKKAEINIFFEIFSPSLHRRLQQQEREVLALPVLF